jgi:uncharacterized membrane protein YqiK
MDQWNQKNENLGMSEDEVYEYANELTISLEQYEEYLKNQNKELAIELRLATRKINSQMTELKEHCQFKLEAADQALLETKIKYTQQLNEAQMYAAELECRFVNCDKPPKYVSGIIDEIERGLVLHNTAEARVYIEKLTGMLKD